MVKVYASEMLDYVVDEGVQIHGGYGYHQDYTVERAYRDSRINRLFEGTSEINRLVITGMPLKRAARGLLPLFEAARAVLQETEPQSRSCNVRRMRSRALVHNAKKIALLTLGVAHEKYRRATGTTAGDHHESLRHHRWKSLPWSRACCAAANWRHPEVERTPPTPAPCTCAMPSHESNLRREPC